MIGCECLLERRQRAGFAKALDGFHDGAVDLNRQHEARSHRRAVHDHGARAADTVLAAKMRAGQPERVPQKIAEMNPRIDPGLAPFAVERECQRNCSVMTAAACVVQASFSARRISTPAR